MHKKQENITARIMGGVMPKKKGKSIPNVKRAVSSGKIATIYKGRRIVQRYTSGQPLMGDIEQ